MYKCLLYYPIKRVENQSKKYHLFPFLFYSIHTHTHTYIIPFSTNEVEKQNKKQEKTV